MTNWNFTAESLDNVPAYPQTKDFLGIFAKNSEDGSTYLHMNYATKSISDAEDLTEYFTERLDLGWEPTKDADFWEQIQE